MTTTSSTARPATALQAHLVRLGACAEAVTWAGAYEMLPDAWAACERPDWMLWLLARVVSYGSDDHRALVRTACACARLVLPYVPVGETRPLAAIEAAEEWADGHVEIAAVRAAVSSAYAAAYAAFAYASYYAYAAFAYAATSAYAATYAAFAATAYADAHASAGAELCVLIRQRHPQPPVLRLED